MAKLQIDGIEIAVMDAARAVRVLRLVRENGPGTVAQVSRQDGKQPAAEVLLPLTFGGAPVVRRPKG
jgi:hypothetical protein